VAGKTATKAYRRARKLERDGQPQVIAEARRLLCEMEQTLARMQADIRRAAQERLGSSTKRDTPM
jgi:hypothetical protein